MLVEWFHRPDDMFLLGDLYIYLSAGSSCVTDIPYNATVDAATAILEGANVTTGHLKLTKIGTCSYECWTVEWLSSPGVKDFLVVRAYSVSIRHIFSQNIASG